MTLSFATIVALLSKLSSDSVPNGTLRAEPIAKEKPRKT